MQKKIARSDEDALKSHLDPPGALKRVETSLVPPGDGEGIIETRFIPQTLVKSTVPLPPPPPVVLHEGPNEKSRHEHIEYKIVAIGLAGILVCVILGIQAHATNWFFNLVLLTFGLVVLLGASNGVLEYSVKIAEGLHIPEILIGLTLISLGTSFPEMFTSMIASSQGIGALVVGNIIGSYVTQLTIFLGICILLVPVTVSREHVPSATFDILLMMGSLSIMCLAFVDGVFTMFEAVLSIGLYVIYIYYLYRRTLHDEKVARKKLLATLELEELQGIHTHEGTEDLEPAIHHLTPPAKRPKEKPAKLAFYALIVLINALLCYVGANFMVDASVNLAHTFSVPEYVIGAIFVGFGTGLPEFVISFTAVRQKKHEIAYGNLMGSNIVDPLISISLGAFVAPIVLPEDQKAAILGILYPFALVVGLVMVAFFSRRTASRSRGIFLGLLLIGIYVVFTALTLA
jgi:cation:H+ antiporter